MSNGTVTATAPTFPLFSVLGVVFIVLKLTGVIAWSWWWVLAPFWIPFALFLLFLPFIVMAVVAASKAARTRHERIRNSNDIFMRGGRW